MLQRNFGDEIFIQVVQFRIRPNIDDEINLLVAEPDNFVLAVKAEVNTSMNNRRFDWSWCWELRPSWSRLSFRFG